MGVDLTVIRSRQEMAQAVGMVQYDISSGVLSPEDLSHCNMEQHLYTKVGNPYF